MIIIFVGLLKHKFMFKTSKLLFVVSAFIFLFPFTASAFTVKSGESVTLPKEESIKGNYFAAGNNLVIDGKIEGDLICAGQSLNINGEIGGDVICAAQTININGNVNGSVRILANAANINSTIEKNLMVGAATVNTASGSSIGGETLVAGAVADLKGKTSGDLSAAGSTISLGGEVGKNVNIRINSKDENNGLLLLDSAKIAGDLNYTDSAEAKISPSARIGGKTNHNLPSYTEKNKDQYGIGWIWGKIYSMFAAMVIGLVLVLIWSKETDELTDKMFNKIGASVGWGAVVLIVTPVAAIILMITLIGFPLAILLLLIWAVAIWLSKIFVAILVGKTFLEKFWKDKKSNLLLSLVIGTVISWTIFAIPIIGWILCFIAVLWGMGGIFLFFKKD